MTCQSPTPFATLSALAMPPAPANPPANSVPLCVDLDGTLIRTDVLWVSLAQLLRRRPFSLLAVPLWFLRGRAFLKRQVANRTTLDPATLPYHREFLEFLRAERAQGRRLILVTASDDAPAQIVARHVGLFDEVLASNGVLNLRGRNKGRRLVERFGERGFDYAGNSRVDFPVWQVAREAIVVNASKGVTRQARAIAKVGRVFD